MGRRLDDAGAALPLSAVRNFGTRLRAARAPHSCALVSALALRALARDQRRARERAAAAGVKLTGDIASPARRLNPTIRRARAVSASTCSSPARAAKAAT